MSFRRVRVASTLAASILVALASSTLVGCAEVEETAETAESQSAVSTARPPQFVIFSLSGSRNVSFWRESRDFARVSGVKLTYFVNAADFVTDDAADRYVSPGGRGKSSIGFGGTAEQVTERFEELRLASSDGHEIASGGVAQLRGAAWSRAEWSRDLAQLGEILFRGYGVSPPALGFSELAGFRAPYLAGGTGLEPALARAGIAYDSSKREPRTNYWPEKKGDVWSFALPAFPIEGSRGRAFAHQTFDLYLHDTDGREVVAKKAQFKERMLASYRAYFESSYRGNRAPVHVSHHFAKWNGGAYWEATQELAQELCGLPEVRCGTYRDLVAFMEANQSRRDTLQAGDFAPLSDERAE